MSTVTGSAPREGKLLLPYPDKFDGSYERFEHWWQDLLKFLMMHEAIYDSDKRIILVLNNAKEGTVCDTWCQNKWKQYREDAFTAQSNAIAIFPTWRDFSAEIEKKFTQPLEQQEALAKLQSLRQSRNTASEFFNKFDLYKRAAKQDNETFIIFLLRSALDHSILMAMASSGTLPTTYLEWKERAIAIDESRRLFLKGSSTRPSAQELGHIAKRAQHRQGSSSSQPSGSAVRDGQGTVYGGSGQPMEIGRTRVPGRGYTCNICGKKGHFIFNCPERKNRVPVRIVEQDRLPPPPPSNNRFSQNRGRNDKGKKRADPPRPFRAVETEDDAKITQARGLLAVLSKEDQDFLLMEMASDKL
jgi:hypothetical protein